MGEKEVIRHRGERCPRADILWRMRLVLSVLVLLVMGLGSNAVESPLFYQLGLTANATTEDVLDSYQQHAQTWTVDKKYSIVEIQKIIDIEHAYHVLSNVATRRVYDNFRIDLLEADVESIRQLYNQKGEAQYLQFPLWRPKQLNDKIESTAEIITTENFGELVLESSDLWVIQIYSAASPECHAFAPAWTTAVTLMEGVVKIGRVELSEFPLSMYLAERNWMHGYPFFRNGLPTIIAVQPGCKFLRCIDRYHGEKNADAIADWVATRLLRLPRILYYTPQTLMTDIIQKPGPHKVKVIQFSNTGLRAPLYLRKAVRDYQEYAVFAMVLWRESDSTFWETKVGVESGPATVFLKDPGLAPVIHHGKLSSSTFNRLIEKHKKFELPQLRSITAVELGCDVSRYMLPVQETKIWYCVVVAGRAGLALSQMRSVLRLAQDQLSSPTEESSSLASVKAFKDRRLSLAWLDGAAQKEFCYFYLNSETMFEACGPPKYELDDIPKIFLIRYIKEVEKDATEPEKKRWLPKTVWEKEAEEEKGYASQIVTRYNGSPEVPDLVEWMSMMVIQGDTEDLPSFKGKAPDLIAEESVPFTAKAQEFVAERRDKLVDSGKGFFRLAHDFKKDPKFLPIVLFVIFFYTVAFFLSANHKRKLASQAQKEKAVLEAADIKATSSENSSIAENSAGQNTSASSEGLRRRETFQSS